MERASNTQKEGEDDDIEPELQRIKDDEDIHERDTREPDIPVAAELPPLPLEEKAAPMQAQAPVIVPVKIPTTVTTHVKTPDEVEDLPEHEAVDQISGSDQIIQEQENIVEDMEVSAAESNAAVEAPEVEELSPAEEKKIALDLQEKETCDEKEKHSEEEEENEEAKVKTPLKEEIEKDVSEKEASEKDASEKGDSAKDDVEKDTSEKEASEKEAAEKDASEKETYEKEVSQKDASEKEKENVPFKSDKEDCCIEGKQQASEKEESEKEPSEKEDFEKDASEKDGSENEAAEKDISEKETSEKYLSQKDTDAEVLLEVVSATAIDDVQSPESEGAQEQRDLSEVIVSAQQQLMPEKQDEDVSAESQEPPRAVEFYGHVIKLRGVLASVISYYEDELESSKSLANDDKNLQNEIGARLEHSIDLLSTLDCHADPSDEKELQKLKNASVLATELVRKCMKLAIELIEAESKDANSFMEYLHSEPDLILNCQEIENFCNNLLPAEIEAPAEKETEGKADDEKDHCSDTGVDDKEEQCIGDEDIARVSPDNVADVDKEAGLFFL